MRICGIVSEYNPFHRGHEIHIRLTREKTGADLIICAMSGNFVQRGEPAVFDKWVRAACALKCGADAVVELPLLYSVQSAEGFASGSMAVLDAAGADCISFGCETDDLDSLAQIAKIFANESDEYKRLLKENLNKGMSFPKARMLAACINAPDEFIMPNAILGIEYIKAIYKNGLNIKPYVIKRIGQGYHSSEINGPIASATAIRSELNKGNIEKAISVMPEVCADYIRPLLGHGLLPVSAELFDKELNYILRRGGTEYIKNLPDVSEGLENRIYAAASDFSTREQLIDKIKTKRYTYTRISRILICALLGINRSMVDETNVKQEGYIRVLGVKSPEVLSKLSSVCKVPMITGAVASSGYSIADIRAADIYALTQKAKPFSSAARDFTEKLIID